MSREWDALSNLKTYITSMLDATPQPALVADQIVIGYPDEDRMRYSTMFFLVPEQGTWETLTYESLLESLAVRLYIVIKPQSTLTSVELMVRALFDYFAALRNAVVTDPTAGNSFDEVKINSFDFYPAIEGMAKSVGLDISMQIQFECVELVVPGGDLYPGEDVHPVGG